MIPTVSVVIPTRHRPEQLCAAVHSALEQRLDAHNSLEVIVVLDGSDPIASRLLDSICDERLRVYVNPTPRGHSTSRNIGVSHAKGAWCAFLDDDDTWMSEKLSVQLSCAAESSAKGVTYPVVGCVLEARTSTSTHLWPERFLRNAQPIGDYLYSRSGYLSVRSGHTLMQTSMLLVPTALMHMVPFDGGMRRHADPDWLLRAQCTDGVGFVFPELNEPLAVWNISGDCRVSASGDWKYSMVWARRHRHLLSPSAYSGFLSGPAAHIAASTQPSSTRLIAFLVLFREMFAEGTPSIWDIVSLLVKFFNIKRHRSDSDITRTMESAP
jgi:glycosyltransferase involved in cell wall biosynthesis